MADMLHQFNTRRLYSAHGQRIIATSNADGSGNILFHDIERMIFGVLDHPPPQGWGNLTEKERQKHILSEYDFGSYRYHADACDLKKLWNEETARTELKQTLG